MKVKFVKKIGQGGFGIVNEVLGENGNTYAEKIFQPPNHLDPELIDNVRKRFVREANFQKMVDHPNIVPVLKTNLSSDPPSYLMPLAKSSLDKDQVPDRTLGGKFMECVLDVLAGLEELHSIEYYHRDLKPGNILKFNSQELKRDYYAISDFGLMSLNESTITTLTKTNMQKGSDMYTAPEIAASLKKASAQSDIYSMGCILHDFIGTDIRIPCGEINEEGPFSAILLGCTRRDPNRRFKSVRALREALLSLGDITVTPETEKGKVIFDLLTDEDKEISKKEWETIVSYIEDNSKAEDAIVALRRISIVRIEQLLETYDEIGARLGKLYAEWIRFGYFIFDQCDGLAVRLSYFIDNCGVEVKAECLLALLYMGTSHNRWYVERKFVSYTNPSLEEAVAKRLSMELRVDGDDACKAIRHLTRSISFNIDNLHPEVIKAVKEICSK